MGSLNHALFLALNASADPSGPVVMIAILLAKYVIALVPAHIVLVWVYGDRPMRFVALHAVLALAIAVAINQAIGLIAYSPRPFLVGLGHTLIEHRPSSSLPSNHATVFLTYAAVLALHARRALALVVLALGILVAWSRIYLGVHYPFDMLAAVVTSGIAAFSVRALVDRIAPVLLPRAEMAYDHAIALLHRHAGAPRNR